MQHEIDRWAEGHWSGQVPEPAVQFHGEELGTALKAAERSEQQRFGSRARLARSIRGVRHLRLPDRSALKRPQLVFSADGYDTYARTLETIGWADLVASHPMRDYSRHRGQQNKPIAYYSRTVEDLVNCESRLERSFALVADWHPKVVHLAAQPFALQFPVDDAMRVHTVDFVVLAHGRVPLAVDVKTPEAAAKEDWVDRHRRVAEVLSHAGIGHVVWTGENRTAIENLALFASARVPALLRAQARAAVGAAVVGLVPARQVAAVIASSMDDLTGDDGRTVPARIIAPAILRAMLWDRELRTDLTVPFTFNSLVQAP